jgi:hypothetical protein
MDYIWQASHLCFENAECSRETLAELFGVESSESYNLLAPRDHRDEPRFLPLGM